MSTSTCMHTHNDTRASIHARSRPVRCACAQPETCRVRNTQVGSSLHVQWKYSWVTCALHARVCQVSCDLYCRYYIGILVFNFQNGHLPRLLIHTTVFYRLCHACIAHVAQMRLIGVLIGMLGMYIRGVYIMSNYFLSYSTGHSNLTNPGE